MIILPRRIDFVKVEKKWQDIWEEEGTYEYDWEDNDRTRYSIDTPPPYPSGDFHMGNVLNWTYFDIRARFKRMQGLNVHFPQGWDCHGLPTEVAVEKAHNIRRSDLPPDEFRALCEEWIEQYIGKMKVGGLSNEKKQFCVIWRREKRKCGFPVREMTNLDRTLTLQYSC